jgi:tRNA dimethylallyltransferase
MAMMERAGLYAVAVVGPTASGKSALALTIADAVEMQGGPPVEILCCDSMQVYRGFDIGTAKPSPEERRRRPHHLLDVADPSEQFDAAAWARFARQVISEIIARGALPVIVGGTGLYFRALRQGIFDAPRPDPEIRQRHRESADQMGLPTLHAELARVDPESAARVAPTDLVRISRALEIYEQTGTPMSVLWKMSRPVEPIDTLTVLMDPPLDVLRLRIAERTAAMLAAGLVQEVTALRRLVPADARCLQSIGYREVGQMLDAVLLPDALETEISRNTAAFARRQRTWFRKERVDVRLESAAVDKNPKEIDELASTIQRWLRAPS